MVVGCASLSGGHGERTGVAMADEIGDPNAVGPDGLPAIIVAIEREDMARVKALIGAGANLEAGGFHEATPALSAALADNWPMVLVLLEAGANPNPADQMGFTLPYLTMTSRVVPSGRYGQALNEVRQILNSRGLLEKIMTPDEVKPLVWAGKWSPR